MKRHGHGVGVGVDVGSWQKLLKTNQVTIFGKESADFTFEHKSQKMDIQNSRYKVENCIWQMNLDIFLLFVVLHQHIQYDYQPIVRYEKQIT